MFSKVICYKGFWKSVTFLAVMFIIIYNAVDIFMVFGGSISSYMAERFASENLLRFLSANIASSFVYGFIVSFFKFRGRIKKEEHNTEKNS
jgi:hypothetical protein